MVRTSLMCRPHTSPANHRCSNKDCKTKRFWQTVVHNTSKCCKKTLLAGELASDNFAVTVKTHACSLVTSLSLQNILAGDEKKHIQTLRLYENIEPAPFETRLC